MAWRGPRLERAVHATSDLGDRRTRGGVPAARRARRRYIRHGQGRSEHPALRLPRTRDDSRSGAGRRHLLAHVDRAIVFEALLHYDHLARPPVLRPLTAAAPARTLRRLPGLDGAPATRHPLRRRSRVRRPAARTHRPRLRLRAQAPCRPGQPQPDLADDRIQLRDRRPDGAAQHGDREPPSVRLRPRDPGPPGARPLHAGSSRSTTRARGLRSTSRAATCSAPSRAKSSSTTGATSMPTRSAPARTAWSNGSAGRASCSSATRPTDRGSTTHCPRPTIPRARRCSRA